MDRSTVTVLVILMMMMMIGSVTTVPEYRTKLRDLPSPDWYSPIRQFISILYSQSETERVWNVAGSDPWTVSDRDMPTELVVFAFIGICLAAITVVIFVCFVVCRCCCAKCGGNYRQSLKTSQNRLRINILSVFLAFLLVVSLIPLAYVYSSLPMKSSLASNYMNSIDDNIVDMGSYLSYTKQEIDDLIETDIIQTIDHQHKEIQNFGYDVGSGVIDYVRRHSKVEAVFTDLSDVAKGIVGAKTVLDNVVNDTNQINDQVKSVNDDLNKLVDNLSTFLDECNQECKTPDFCNDCTAIDYLRSVIHITLNTLNINLTEPLNELQRSIDRDIPNAVANFNSSFENLPNVVQNDSLNTINEILDKLSTAKVSIRNSTEQMDSFFDSLTKTISDLHRDLGKHIDINQVDHVYTTIYVVSLTIAIVLSVIRVYFACGLIGGWIAFDPKVSPTDRSALSDFFGSLLITAAYLSLFVSYFLWLVQALVSIPGVAMELYICRPLFDPSYHTLDQIAFIQPDNYTSRSNITISTILHSCERNSSAMQAFGLNSTVDINGTLQLNLDELKAEWKSINVSEWKLDLYPTDFKDNLNDLTGALTIDFNDHLVDIDTILKNLSSTANNLFELSNFLAHLRAVPALDPYVEPLILDIDQLYKLSQESCDHLNQLRSNMENFQIDASNMRNQVKYSLLELPNIEDAVKYGVIATIRDYSVDFIQTIDEAISNLIDSLFNHVGNCDQLWVIFQSVRVSTCRDVADSVNAFWFCLAVVLLLFLVSVPPAVKLSKYYRIMNKPSKKDDRFQRTQATRIPEKIHHTKNAYFDGREVVPTISNQIDDHNILTRRPEPPPPIKPKPSQSKIQPIIMAFDRLPYVPPRQPYEVVPEPQKTSPAAIKLRQDQFDLYQPIPRVLNRSSSSMSTASSATYMTLNQPSSPTSSQNPYYVMQRYPSNSSDQYFR